MYLMNLSANYYFEYIVRNLSYMDKYRQLISLLVDQLADEIILFENLITAKFDQSEKV